MFVQIRRRIRLKNLQAMHARLDNMQIKPDFSVTTGKPGVRVHSINGNNPTDSPEETKITP